MQKFRFRLKIWIWVQKLDFCWKMLIFFKIVDLCWKFSFFLKNFIFSFFFKFCPKTLIFWKKVPRSLLWRVGSPISGSKVGYGSKYELLKVWGQSVDKVKIWLFSTNHIFAIFRIFQLFRVFGPKSRLWMPMGMLGRLSGKFPQKTGFFLECSKMRAYALKSGIVAGKFGKIVFLRYFSNGLTDLAHLRTWPRVSPETHVQKIYLDRAPASRVTVVRSSREWCPVNGPSVHKNPAKTVANGPKNFGHSGAQRKDLSRPCVRKGQRKCNSFWKLRSTLMTCLRHLCIWWKVRKKIVSRKYCWLWCGQMVFRFVVREVSY